MDPSAGTYRKYIKKTSLFGPEWPKICDISCFFFLWATDTYNENDVWNTPNDSNKIFGFICKKKEK